jgi:hypothetical protein
VHYADFRIMPDLTKQILSIWAFQPSSRGIIRRSALPRRARQSIPHAQQRYRAFHSKNATELLQLGRTRPTSNGPMPANSEAVCHPEPLDYADIAPLQSPV